jgi:hypothetical protein
LPFEVTLSNKIRAAAVLKLNQYDRYDPSYGAGSYLCEHLKNRRFDIIIANDIDPLPTVARLADKDTKILLDAHEYFPDLFGDDWKFKFFFREYNNYLFEKYLPRIDAMLTVSNGVADAYDKKFGIRAELVLNVPEYVDLSPGEVVGTNIKIIHHGGAAPSRCIENYLELVALLRPEFSLYLMLMPTSPKYHKKLVEIINKNSRVHLVPPVQPLKIAAAINEYDIGVHMLKPVGLNHKYAMPNKLFEFIQGRLGVMVWPGTEMSETLDRFGCGLSSAQATIESMADALNNLTLEKIREMKSKSNEAAKVLNMKSSEEKFLGVVDQLMRK